VVHNPESVKTVDASDVTKAFDEMIEARRPKVSNEDRMREMLKEATEGLGKVQLDEPQQNFEVKVWFVLCFPCKTIIWYLTKAKVM